MKRKEGINQQKKTSNKNLMPAVNRDILTYCPERYALPPGYFASPSQQMIFATNGQCPTLIIGNNHGEACWAESIDLSSLAAPLK